MGNGTDVRGESKRKRCTYCKYYCYFVYLPVLLAIVAALGIRGFTQELGRYGWGGAPRTIEEELAQCPRWLVWFLRDVKIHPLVRMYQKAAEHRSTNSSSFNPSWADDYATIFWWTGVRGLIGMYQPRHSDSIRIPSASADPPSFRVGSIVAPDRDIDDPVYWPMENYIPRFLWNTFFLPVFACYQGILRDAEFNDDLDSDAKNTWATLVSPSSFPRKRDWLMSFYEGYTQFDGKSPVYPVPENDFASLFLQNDMWDDGLEKALAFDLIGAHRVEVSTRVFQGEVLPFVIATNSIASVEVRPFFGKYGADMYFTNEGLPALIVTPDGRQIARGSKDWHYWKFVWRSTLASMITFVDHLHLTHFRAAAVLARAARKALPANSFFRRWLSIFTFGTTWVNNIAMHMLLGTGHVLHRSTPFKDFAGLVESIPGSLRHITNYHKPFFNETAWDELPNILKEAPYFADGRLLANALQRLIMRVSGIMMPLVCPNDTIANVDYLRFTNELLAEEEEAGYVPSFSEESKNRCSTRGQTILSMMWTVTGWHRHVGRVADIFRDPDLAAFSWRDGESAPRPRQAMLMSVVAAVTGTQHPKISEDFTHLFKDMEQEAGATALLREFQKELDGVHTEIVRRNEHRRVKNYHSDPRNVECSVAV
eukprot:TRINITY_DN24093_c0_g2_i1.p1 TRINITY_DN24093_c0_g2~~TRINITY_DN24093_c0_g2_i1.p1  ORF type:complete len:673 (+),score=67.07 TRINITY_DN24093_c0_g2_i1:66-2021(+)